VSDLDTAKETVRGERGRPAIDHARTAASRVSSVLAVGLMSVLGLGALTWYYANTVQRQSRARQSAQAAATRRAQGDLPLPPLGRIELLKDPVTAPPAAGLGVASIDPPPLTVAAASPSDTKPVMYGAPPSKSSAQLARERPLSGEAFAAQASLGTKAPGTGTLESGHLPQSSRPSVTTAVRAQVLPTTRLLLPTGAFIDCTLETAIDSTLAGMTTCITATDTFGVDGKVVLLERGTKLVGETKGQVQQGTARVFVIWNEARTPTGVIVPLDSPGADELGRAGLPGEVNRHFWERFGAAMLISVINGAVQAAVQSSSNGGGTVIVDPAASQGVITEVLKSTVNIPPTVVKSQGDRIQVMVARDLDFRSVYALRADPTER
jgi:type IV secretion system protein VirB10